MAGPGCSSCTVAVRRWRGCEGGRRLAGALAAIRPASQQVWGSQGGGKFSSSRCLFVVVVFVCVVSESVWPSSCEVSQKCEFFWQPRGWRGTSSLRLAASAERPRPSGQNVAHAWRALTCSTSRSFNVLLASCSGRSSY